MCNVPCPVAASCILVLEHVCARRACLRRTPCLPGAGMSQAAVVSHIFHPSCRRRWAGSVPAWVGLGEAVGSGYPRILLPRHSWVGTPGLLCQRIPSLQPQGVVAAERGMRGGEWDSSCCFLPAGMQRSWWGGVP